MNIYLKLVFVYIAPLQVVLVQFEHQVIGLSALVISKSNFVTLP